MILDTGIRRLNLGGKLMTNYLKELVSYRYETQVQVQAQAQVQIQVSDLWLHHSADVLGGILAPVGTHVD